MDVDHEELAHMKDQRAMMDAENKMLMEAKKKLKIKEREDN